MWALIHEESPKNVAVFLNEDSHTLFNLTATFSRSSHFPITLQYVPNLTVFTGNYDFIQTKNVLCSHFLI